MASRGGVSGGRGGGGGDESDSSSGIEQGDEPSHVHRPPSQCSEGSNASSGSGDTEGPEEGFSSDHAQVILHSICVGQCLLRYVLLVSYFMRVCHSVHDWLSLFLEVWQKDIT